MLETLLTQFYIDTNQAQSTFSFISYTKYSMLFNFIAKMFEMFILTTTVMSTALLLSDLQI